MKSISDLVREMNQCEQEIAKLDSQMPRILGAKAVKVTRENFETESYNGVKWQPRKAKTNRAYDRRGTYKGSVYNSANPLLRQTGNLFNSIKYVVTGSTIDVGVNLSQVPYAVAHNEGKNHQPKRQFIGYSLKLDIQLRDEIEKRHAKIFNQFKK